MFHIERQTFYNLIKSIHFCIDPATIKPAKKTASSVQPFISCWHFFSGTGLGDISLVISVS